MSTYLAVACLDLVPGAMADVVVAWLRARLHGRISPPSTVWIRRLAAPGRRQRLVVHGDYCNVELPPVIRGLLAERPEIERAVLAVDWDEFSTEHEVLRQGGVVVHSVEVVDLTIIPEQDHPADARPLPCGLVRHPGRRGEFDPSDGATARAAAARLFGAPPERMEEAERELEGREDLMLRTSASTYGMWWRALGVPLLGADLTGEQIMIH
jgi:hypothetical protein